MHKKAGGDQGGKAREIEFGGGRISAGGARLRPREAVTRRI